MDVLVSDEAGTGNTAHLPSPLNIEAAACCCTSIFANAPAATLPFDGDKGLSAMEVDDEFGSNDTGTCWWLDPLGPVPEDDREALLLLLLFRSGGSESDAGFPPDDSGPVGVKTRSGTLAEPEPVEFNAAKLSFEALGEGAACFDPLCVTPALILTTLSLSAATKSGGICDRSEPDIDLATFPGGIPVAPDAVPAAVVNEEESDLTISCIKTGGGNIGSPVSRLPVPLGPPLPVIST